MCHLDMPKHKPTGSLRAPHSQVTKIKAEKNRKKKKKKKKWQCEKNINEKERGTREKDMQKN